MKNIYINLIYLKTEIKINTKKKTYPKNNILNEINTVNNYLKNVTTFQPKMENIKINLKKLNGNYNSSSKTLLKY